MWGPLRFGEVRMDGRLLGLDRVTNYMVCGAWAPLQFDFESTKTLGNAIDHECRLQEGLWDKNASLGSEVKLLLASHFALRLSFTFCVSLAHQSPLVKA